MIEVLRTGAMTSVQDLGRFGYRHLGVGQAGALDPIAMRQGNLILGNPENAAVLEIGFGPLHLFFATACSIVLTGVDFAATIHNESKPAEAQAVLPGYPANVQAGSTLSLLRPTIAGAKAYLAFAGGIDVPLVMGSRSTDLNNRFGGLNGRAVQAGDFISLAKHTHSIVPLNSCVRSFAPRHILRALPGPDYDLFTDEAHTRFWLQPWGISHQSNRMGMRLKGKNLPLQRSVSLLSSGVLPGDVQVPDDGLPIILANDAQTIGGYPRIASVIQADLWQLAHMSPNTSVYFQPVSHAIALAAKAQQDHYFQRLTDLLQKAARVS